MNVTANPTAEWTLQQLREVVGDGGANRYLIHDRDRIFAKHLNDSIRAMGLKVLKSPVASPKASDTEIALRATAIQTAIEQARVHVVPASAGSIPKHAMG